MNGDFLRQEVAATTNYRNMIESNDDFLRQEVTQMSDRAHKMSLEELKESNGDFLRQEVTAANDCRMI